MPRATTPHEANRNKHLARRLRAVIGENVSKAARETGIKQRTLANHLDENSPTLPSVFTLLKIAKHYERPLEWFLGEQEAPEGAAREGSERRVPVRYRKAFAECLSLLTSDDPATREYRDHLAREIELLAEAAKQRTKESGKK